MMLIENQAGDQYYMIDNRDLKEDTVDNSILNMMEEEPLFTYQQASLHTTLDAEDPLSLRDSSLSLSHSGRIAPAWLRRLEAEALESSPMLEGVFPKADIPEVFGKCRVEGKTLEESSDRDNPTFLPHSPMLRAYAERLFTAQAEEQHDSRWALETQCRREGWMGSFMQDNWFQGWRMPASTFSNLATAPEMLGGI
jgi:hypothetical protein